MFEPSRSLQSLEICSNFIRQVHIFIPVTHPSYGYTDLQYEQLRGHLRLYLFIYGRNSISLNSNFEMSKC